MRFISLVKAHGNAEKGVPPSPQLMAAIGKLAEELTKTGKIVEMGGLMPSSKGALLRLSGGKITVTDGPFAEAKELIGGYAVFDVKSKDEMIELAKRFLQVHVDVLGTSCELGLEIRQMADQTGIAAAR